jgi:hypothetical protein
VSGKEERKEKEGGGQEQHKCHVEVEMLHTALVKGICCEFIKIYNSRSDIEGVKDLRVKGIYFMLEKWGEQPKICTNQ